MMKLKVECPHCEEEFTILEELKKTSYLYCHHCDGKVVNPLTPIKTPCAIDDQAQAHGEGRLKRHDNS